MNTKYRLRFISPLDGQPYEEDFTSLLAVFRALTLAYKLPDFWELYKLGDDGQGFLMERELLESSATHQSDCPPSVEHLHAALSPYSPEYEETQQEAIGW